MALLHLDSPLYLTRLALLQPGDQTVRVIDLSCPQPPLPVMPADGAVGFGVELDGWRKTCGIPRPSTASRASVLGATVSRALLTAGAVPPARLGVTSASTTSATGCAVEFDSRGLAEGWNAVNPLLLPSTLPSALATQITLALGAQGCVQAFLTGLLGVFHALEAAALALRRGDADAMLTVAADECGEVQQRAHQALQQWPVPPEFAGALMLEPDAPAGTCSRLAFISYGGAQPAIPDGWHNAPRYSTQAPSAPPSMQNGAAFRALADALLARLPRAVVCGHVPGLGSAGIGLELTS